MSYARTSRAGAGWSTRSSPGVGSTSATTSPPGGTRRAATSRAGRSLSMTWPRRSSARSRSRAPAVCCGWPPFGGSRRKGARKPAGSTTVTVPPPLPSRRRSGHGNALLGWELLRVSRKIGALAVGRFMFGAALLGVMWLIWSAGYANKQFLAGNITEIANELNRFAGDFSQTFFMVQLAIVLLLTPIFVAGSVFEERETRSGEVLLTTDLTRREVFYGKFLARVVQVIMVVAAGMPILALTLLWGGVAIHFVVIGYVATFCCIFSSGAVAASVAGGSETLREAIL